MEKFPQLSILIVDDDELLCQLLSEMLTAEKFLVEYVFNGSSALDILKTKLFDLVILNLNMPGISGDQLLPKIKNDFPSLPIFMLSGQSDPSAIVRCIKLGAVDYFTKPFDYDTILDAIIKYFKRN